MTKPKLTRVFLEIVALNNTIETLTQSRNKLIQETVKKLPGQYPQFVELFREWRIEEKASK